MRTNIVLDDELVERAQQLSGIKTKREVVDQALRMFIRVYGQVGVRALRGRLRWEGDLAAQREGRFHDPC